MKTTYSPKEFGKLIGRSTVTLQRWDRQGILRANRSPTNRRYYTHEQYLQYSGAEVPTKLVLGYCRVAKPSQKKQLLAQRACLEQFCVSSGRAVAEYFEDIGSALDYQRQRFTQLLEMVERGLVSEIVTPHEDRLVRFGYDWFAKFCHDRGARVIALNAPSASPDEELVDDLRQVVLQFSHRLKYSRHAAWAHAPCASTTDVFIHALCRALTEVPSNHDLAEVETLARQIDEASALALETASSRLASGALPAPPRPRAPRKTRA